MSMSYEQLMKLEEIPDAPELSECLKPPHRIGSFGEILWEGKRLHIENEMDGCTIWMISMEMCLFDREHTQLSEFRKYSHLERTRKWLCTVTPIESQLGQTDLLFQDICCIGQDDELTFTKQPPWTLIQAHLQCQPRDILSAIFGEVVIIKTTGEEKLIV